MSNNPPSIATGYFSKIDSIHVHVDGGGEPGPVEHIVEQLEIQGLLGKITPIKEAIPGPQREESWAVGTYESHTPGQNGQEHLEFFSTTLLSHDLRNLPDAIQKLNQVLSLLYEQQPRLPQGIVVEVERVIGKGEGQIVWSKIPVDEDFIIRAADVGFERHRTAEIEIHYTFDIPRTGQWRDIAPLTLIDLKKACIERGIPVGGWFFFDDDKSWAYRSNQFARIERPREIEQTQAQLNKLNQYLDGKGKELGFECKVSALVEQILGVWRTPLRPVDKRLKKNIQQLAEWEAGGDLEEFWVVAPNFLGDTRGDVRRAMVYNLKNRVKYTYFLRSFADVQRLRKFAETLEPDVKGGADVFKLIKAVLLESTSSAARDIFEEEYFIANPRSEKRDGYRLLRTTKGKIYAGERMSPADFQRVDDLFAGSVKQNQIMGWTQIDLRRDSGRAKPKAIACVRLSKRSKEGMQLNEHDWEVVINEFDQMVADHVSKLSGQVVKGYNGYFIIFDDVESALTCASWMQKSVERYNKGFNQVEFALPKITIDFGHVIRVLRSYGFDFSGAPISICAKLIDRANDGDILVTRSVEDNVSPAVKSLFRIIEQGTWEIEELGTIELRTLDWR